MSRIETLLTYLAQSPNDPFLQYALALEYAQAGEIKKALAYFEKLVNQHPDYSATYYHYGKLLAELGQLNFALEIIKRGIVITQAEKNRHAENELRLLLEEYED